MNSPSPNGGTGAGRDAAGRFSTGWRGGPGNPYARRVAELRAALFDAVSPSDLRQVIIALLKQAKSGDVASIKELLQRLLGPPVELDLIARLDALEQQLAQVEHRKRA